MFFEYGEKELSYLRKKDKRLCEVIDRIGHIDRTVDTGLFSSVVHHIIGQQITAKAQETVWQRMRETLGEVSAETVLAAGIPELQSFGMTFRKAEYITDFAGKVRDGAFDPGALKDMSDAEAVGKLKRHFYIVGGEEDGLAKIVSQAAQQLQHLYLAGIV